MKNNINLDKLFSKAKEAEPVFSKDDAHSLIENANIASIGSLNKKKLIGNPIMNIITAAVITAFVVGGIAYNSVSNYQPNIQRKSVQILQKDTKNSTLNPNPTVAEVVNSSKQMDKMNDKHESEITKANEEFSNDMILSESDIKDDVFTNDIIQGVNIIELTEEQAKNIGITIGNESDCIEYISGNFDVNPQLVKIYVDWGVGTNSLNSNQLPTGNNIFEPRMVTDNFGNKRISTFNDDLTSNLSKLEFMDKEKNLYIQSITSNDSDESVNIEIGGVNPSTDGNNNHQSMSYSKSLGWTKNEQPDFQTKNLEIKDEKVVVTNSNYYYSPTQANSDNSSMSFITVVDVDSMLSNLNFDEIIKNSFSNLDDISNKLDFPDSLKNKMMDSIKLILSDSTKKYMNLLPKNYDIKLKLEGNITEEMKQKLKDIHNTNIDSLIKSNFQNQMIFDGNNKFSTDNDFKVKNAQIKIIRNMSADSNMKMEHFKINASSISDELIKLNKLVPVAISIPNAKDRNGNELKNFRFVLWFEPTDDFVNKLPDNIKKQLKNELNTFNNSSDVCENKDVVKGQETYLDVWRACSGAIENLTSYPNPVENFVNIKFNLTERRTVNFSIHDLNGRKVQELGKATLANGTIERSFEVKNLQSGMYLIVAQTEVGEQAVQRIIVR